MDSLTNSLSQYVFIIIQESNGKQNVITVQLFFYLIFCSFGYTFRYMSLLFNVMTFFLVYQHYRTMKMSIILLFAAMMLVTNVICDDSGDSGPQAGRIKHIF